MLAVYSVQLQCQISKCNASFSQTGICIFSFLGLLTFFEIFYWCWLTTLLVKHFLDNQKIESSFFLLLWNKTQATVAVNKQPKFSTKTMSLLGVKRLWLMVGQDSTNMRMGNFNLTWEVQGPKQELRLVGCLFSVKYTNIDHVRD